MGKPGCLLTLQRNNMEIIFLLRNFCILEYFLCRPIKEACEKVSVFS